MSNKQWKYSDSSKKKNHNLYHNTFTLLILFSCLHSLWVLELVTIIITYNNFMLFVIFVPIIHQFVCNYPCHFNGSLFLSFLRIVVTMLIDFHSLSFIIPPNRERHSIFFLDMSLVFKWNVITCAQTHAYRPPAIRCSCCAHSLCDTVSLALFFPTGWDAQLA